MCIPFRVLLLTYDSTGRECFTNLHKGQNDSRAILKLSNLFFRKRLQIDDKYSFRVNKVLS